MNELTQLYVTSLCEKHSFFCRGFAFLPQVWHSRYKELGDHYRGWANSWVTLLTVTSDTQAWCASVPTQALPAGVIWTQFRRRETGIMGLSSVHRTGYRVQWPKEIAGAVQYRVPSWGTHSAIAMLPTERTLGIFWRQRRHVQINSGTALSLRTRAQAKIIIRCMHGSCDKIRLCNDH